MVLCKETTLRGTFFNVERFITLHFCRLISRLPIILDVYKDIREKVGEKTKQNAALSIIHSIALSSFFSKQFRMLEIEIHCEFETS